MLSRRLWCVVLAVVMRQMLLDAALSCLHGAGRIGGSRVPMTTDSCDADGTQEAGRADADGDSIVFLYKLKAGACPKSYGLQVRTLTSLHWHPCHMQKDLTPFCHCYIQSAVI